MTPKQLKDWRNAAGLTLPQAAEKFGVSRRTYLYWEQGTTSQGHQGTTARGATASAIPKLAGLAWPTVARNVAREKAAEERAAAAAKQEAGRQKGAVDAFFALDDPAEVHGSSSSSQNSARLKRRIGT